MQLIFLHLLLFFTVSNSNEKDPDSILGQWKTVQNNLIVEVYKHDTEYKAKVIWFKNTEDNKRPIEEWVDEKNPDKALRNRPIIGMEILKEMIYNPKEKRWEKGKIYDSSSGKIYSSSAWLTKENQLLVRGFWHFEFLGQTMVFEKM